MEKKREANKRGKACWGRKRKRVVRLLSEKNVVFGVAFL